MRSGSFLPENAYSHDFRTMAGAEWGAAEILGKAEPGSVIERLCGKEYEKQRAEERHTSIPEKQKSGGEDRHAAPS